MSETRTAQHTLEPWIVLVNGDGCRDIGAADGSLATCFTHGLYDDPTDEANGRRIVAAVNACAGIPIEALEGGIVAELLEALRAAKVELAVLGRDLKEIDNGIRCYPTALLNDDTMAQVRAAIAKAEGRDHA